MNSELISLAKQFRLNSIVSGKFRPAKDMKNEDYLLSLLRFENRLKQERAAAELIKQAKFPSFKGFEEFDTEFQKGISKKELDTISKLEWVDSLYNIILIGPPGTGKTHIALAIGNKAARSGYKVAWQSMDSERAKLVIFIFSKLRRFLLNLSSGSIILTDVTC